MTVEDKKLGMDCPEGKISFDKAVERLVAERKITAIRMIETSKKRIRRRFDLNT